MQLPCHRDCFLLMLLWYTSTLVCGAVDSSAAASLPPSLFLRASNASHNPPATPDCMASIPHSYVRVCMLQPGPRFLPIHQQTHPSRLSAAPRAIVSLTLCVHRRRLSPCWWSSAPVVPAEPPAEEKVASRDIHDPPCSARELHADSSVSPAAADEVDKPAGGLPSRITTASMDATPGSGSAMKRESVSGPSGSASGTSDAHAYAAARRDATADAQQHEEGGADYSGGAPSSRERDGQPGSGSGAGGKAFQRAYKVSAARACD